MSILYENGIGAFLSTEQFINNALIQIDQAPKVNCNLFKIYSPYSHRNTSNKKKKDTTENEAKLLANSNKLQDDIRFVKEQFASLLLALRANSFLCSDPNEHHPPNNTEALQTAELVYDKSAKNLKKNVLGSNIGPPIVKTLENSNYIFPKNCNFFSKNIEEISQHLLNNQYDLILLDPPWWNKYIRRKRKKGAHAYNMMFNCDLKEIPIESLLSDNGMVVVWCTNSQQHLDYLVKDIFPKWNVKLVAKWYWVKVTMYGEPICEFSPPPGKQPFEQILIAFRAISNNLPQKSKLIVSVPSAIHSHKPPLVEVLQPLLPKKAKCLELFARYLLPNWTSYGNEVLRFQHESLYIFK